ncbi:hypothetical protein D9615_002012 [Tricholomella constricta]|uniref:Uncharacterized protein n=1 Tax=Tricholomella constricta TaxID=117010 RepID=A0A8H5HPF1_9AGAR|nr:hypothetical protein D9615_002012 [Tricholomella constricta]
MLSSFLAIPIALCAAVAAQSSSPSVVCVAGQCLQGFTNTTIGTKLTASGAPVSIQLLPGQYTATTNPQLLHNLLTSSSASYSPSPGFENATFSTSLPLNLDLEPGLAIYSQKLYSGQAGFAQLPSSPSTNTSTPLTASSLAISNNVWVAVTSGSNNRIILWDSIPDVNQLPLKSLSLLEIQSSACSPACSGSGICSASACDSSCSTCFGSASFCLTCSGNELASDGKTLLQRVFTLPSGSPRPVQREMPPHMQPLATFRPGLLLLPVLQVLRAGSCVSANCQGSSAVIPGLGVCLSELVQVPTTTGTGSPALPSVTGLTNPTIVSSRRPLQWWQILLMTLGCAFIFLMFVLCWRRRARKQRAKQTALFVSAKRLDRNMGWRGRLVRFGERFFGHRTRQPILLPTHTYPSDGGATKLRKMREAEDARHDDEYDLDQFIDAYDYPKHDSRYHKGPESLPSLDDQHTHRPTFKTRRKPPPSISSRLLSGHSLYSEVTGKPRQIPEPRQPLRKELLSARYSSSTLSSSLSIRSRGEPDRVVPAPAVAPTEAEAYKLSVQPGLATSSPSPPNPGAYWVQPMNTGGSSRNPFRQ